MLTKSFNPKEQEPFIYKHWEEKGYFKPRSKTSQPLAGTSKPFVVTIPPPNVTGVLHIGHALNNTIQDVLVRWHRMRGDETLWIPGTDHAGIATQNKVEQKLAAKGKTRFDIGRENFIKETWKWKEEYESRILGQLKTMGCSCDWEHTRFTMDEGYSKAVLESFVHYYEQGYLYRGYRITNWCPRCGTSLSDLEVEHEEHEGYLWYIKYQIENEGEIVVATTRPETLLGDTAIAVNPTDTRYRNLIGKMAILPIQGRKIPIIADKYVDKKFGTGAVKVTPAHDPNDYEIGERHNLEKIIVIDLEGKMTAEAGEQFVGKDRYEAREIVLELLKEGDWLSDQKPHMHAVGHCYRCHTVIEPSLTNQWFIRMNELAKPAIEVVKNGEVNFHPKKWSKVYLDWMDNIHDWCVSRQIWWGHQIPAWYREIPKYDDLHQLLKGKTELSAGHSGSPVREKTKPETRFVVPADQLAWVVNELDITEEGLYTDFFDKEKRTRLGEINYTITEKKTTKTGLVVKEWHKGKLDGTDVSFEFRMTTGYSRYEIEFTGKVHENFGNETPIESTDILEHANNSFSETQTVYVGKEKPQRGDWTRDEDVLDTWFSSALWPFAVMGWPEKTNDLKNYYPTTFLSTARDILYLWVARMIMSGLEFTGEIPFNDVYIHATVFNSEGKRMSKSLGTGVDPLELIDKYGTDATRFGLLWQVAQGQDMKFSEDALLMSQRFVNKIWNASKFTLMNLQDYEPASRPAAHSNVSRETFATTDETIEKHLTKEDIAILNKLDEVTKKIDKYLDKYDFQHAAELIYDFFWHDFCDKCIEDAKARIRDNSESKRAAQYTLDTVLKTSLMLLHPFMPFVTEAIWDHLDQKEALIISEWPKNSK